MEVGGKANKHSTPQYNEEDKEPVTYGVQEVQEDRTDYK